MSAADTRCQRDFLPGPCTEQHLKPLLTVARGKNFRCPLHPEHVKFSINAGDGRQRVVFCCNDGRCHDNELTELRAALVALGADESCLGNYGKRKPAPTVVPARFTAPETDPRIAKWEAVHMLPANLNGSLLRMCIQAISECDGKPSCDPWDLLPAESKPFYALAERTGLGNYKYNLFKAFLAM